MPAAVFKKINSFVEAVFEGVHDFENDPLKIVLTNAANPILATHTQLSELTEIDYTNSLSRNLTTLSSSHTAGVYKLVLAPHTLGAIGGDMPPFRYLGVVNDSATNKEIVFFYDYGEELTLEINETVIADFDVSAGSITLS